VVLPTVKPQTLKDRGVVHPGCSLQKTKTEHRFVAIAKAFSKEVVVPRNAGCWGMAGDRGFLFPALTPAVRHVEGTGVRGHSCDGYFSSTRTCEIAMSEAVKSNYESILYLVDESI